MKTNWLATTAVVIALGAGSGVAFAQMPDLQRHEHGASGQNPSMSRPETGHSAAGEERHMGDRNMGGRNLGEHAAQPGMREGAEAARQHDVGSAAREQAQGRHQPRETSQTIGQSGERLGRGEQRGSPNTAPENRAQENRPGHEPHQALQPNREQGKAAETQHQNPAEAAKSAEPGRHGQELGQGRTGRNERQPQNLTGQNQGQRGPGAEQAAKEQHGQKNRQAAQPPRPERPAAQQQGTNPTPAQTTGQARQREGNGQAQSRENTMQPQSQGRTGQAQNEPNGRGQTAATKVNDQQRTQVVDRLRSDRELERARSDVNIRVNVGERLPERVRPRPLPSDIVNIVPEYRGYDYTVIHDEIAIVSPDTREIVDVIPERGYAAEGGGYYGGSYAQGRYAQGRRVELSQEQREVLRHAAFGSATVGSTASSGATCLSLRPVPEELARSNPDLASDKYLAIGNQVVLVDPHDQKVVQVIDY